ncbi:hypothetical protein PCC7418_0869 [Halothece sp. PCC 7418]|nr:hypothetical protein PCC7418_0869 [Halothece sp. PCC 7418]
MIRYLFFGLSLALISSIGVSSVSAQTTEENPYPSSERDTFSSDLGEGISPLDLIHRSNLSRSRSLEEYRIEQQQNLNDAASQFRQQQQQLLEQESQNTTEDTETTEELF